MNLKLSVIPHTKINSKSVVHQNTRTKNINFINMKQKLIGLEGEVDK